MQIHSGLRLFCISTFKTHGFLYLVADGVVMKNVLMLSNIHYKCFIQFANCRNGVNMVQSHSGAAGSVHVGFFQSTVASGFGP